ncbi:MAG: FAD-dependent oxidoreductase [Anaerorhabdus sp.]
MRIIIIGGVAAGMSCATRLRRLNEKDEIIVLEKGDYVSFANCGLPYHLSNEIANRQDLILQSPKSLKERFNIDVRVNNEVIKINRKDKIVTINNGIILNYDKLVIATGQKAFIPKLQNIDKSNNVFTLRTINDMDDILSYINNHKVKKAVVIGGGFIGIEAAENLAKVKINTTIIEANNQLLSNLDIEMAKYAENKLNDNNIKVYLNRKVGSFLDNGKAIKLDNNEILECDLVILSTGIRANSELAENANLELGLNKGIKVNENYQTSDKDIYACGDVIVVNNQVSNTASLISLASLANRQGRQVADNINGINRKNKGGIATSILRAFDLTCASSGLNETALKSLNIDYKAVHIIANNHAGYFPNANSIVLKLIFDKNTGKIYGAQAVGKDGVDKRIDVLATAIKANLTVFDLPELELCYSPPFGSAKDPVNMIGYAALNIVEGISDNIQYYELDEYRKNGAILLDVRSDEEIKNGSMNHDIHIPLNQLRNRLNELPLDKLIIASCHSGQRSYLAERILKNNNFNVKNLDGAYAIYKMGVK